jgi:uncharacterized damage-inducible protein DinB
MDNEFLIKLFEHNNWANQKIIEVCSTLSDEQLNTAPQTTTKGTIRETLLHLVKSQRRYLAILTLPLEERPTKPVPFAEILRSAQSSGEGLIALAGGGRKPFQDPLQTSDEFHAAPWVVMLQVINHATEHREQIKSMLSTLGVTPPEIDGWDYGLATNSLVPISK